jgi:hypothetical protein
VPSAFCPPLLPLFLLVVAVAFIFSVVAVAFLVVIPERNLLLRLPLWLSFRSAAEESAFAFAFAFAIAIAVTVAVFFVIP